MPEELESQVPGTWGHPESGFSSDDIMFQLLKRGYIRDYTRDYYRGCQGGDQEFRL